MIDAPTQNNAPWAENVPDSQYSYYFGICHTWIKESVLPFSHMVKREMQVSGDVPLADDRMQGIMELIKEHAYDGAKRECKPVMDIEKFNDAWEEALKIVALTLEVAE